jgi:hypothetical protein
MSTKLVAIAAALVAGAVFATSANALTIVNKDKINHDVRILVTGAKKVEKVKVDAGKSADVDCSKGCTAHLGKDKGKNDTVIKATDKTLTIMDNKLTVQ